MRVAQQRHLPVDQIGDVRDRDLEHVHRHARMAAVEIAAVQDIAGVGVEQRVVVGAVEFDLEHGARMKGSESSSTPITCGAQRIE